MNENEEQNKKKNRKFLAIMAGIVCLFAVTAFIADYTKAANLEQPLIGANDHVEAYALEVNNTIQIFPYSVPTCNTTWDGTITYNDSVIIYCNGTHWLEPLTGATAQRTQEEIEDFAGAMVSGNTETYITVTYQDTDGTIDFVVTDNWWNADADIAADEIGESKINFATACAAGNHLYVNGNDLACEADDDTTYSAGDNYLYLVSTAFWLNETTLNATIDARAGNSTQLNESQVEAYIFDADNTGSMTTTGNLQAANLTLTDSWISTSGNLALDLDDDGNDLTLHASVGGVNEWYFATDGAFMGLVANPGPANSYLMWHVTETQGDPTNINIYEGGTGHNRFWSSGSVRIGGGANYLCSNLTTDVDCDTPLTGADLVVQDDIWSGGKLYAADWSNISIIESQISDLSHTTDTNANTICTGTTTYLDGEGNCDNIASVYEVQLNNEAGLYAVLSDVSEFIESNDDAQLNTINATKHHVGSVGCIRANTTHIIIDGDGSGC